MKDLRCKAMFRVKPRCRPYSGAPLGDYLQVAIPNLNGKAFGHPIPNFQKPYRLCAERLITTDEDLEKALSILSKHFILVPPPSAKEKSK